MNGLQVDLDSNSARLGEPAIVNLSPTHAEMLFVLKSRYPVVTSRADMVKGVWGRTAPDTVDESIKLGLTVLRKRLAPLGIGIVYVGCGNATKKKSSADAPRGWRLANLAEMHRAKRPRRSRARA